MLDYILDNFLGTVITVWTTGDVSFTGSVTRLGGNTLLVLNDGNLTFINPEEIVAFETSGSTD